MSILMSKGAKNERAHIANVSNKMNQLTDRVCVGHTTIQILSQHRMFRVELSKECLSTYTARRERCQNEKLEPHKYESNKEAHSRTHTSRI